MQGVAQRGTYTVETPEQDIVCLAGKHLGRRKDFREGLNMLTSPHRATQFIITIHNTNTLKKTNLVSLTSVYRRGFATSFYIIP